MNWFVVYTVPPRFNHPGEMHYYKQGFENQDDALEFYTNRKLNYPDLPIWKPDQIGFYPRGPSKEFLDLVNRKVT